MDYLSLIKDISVIGASFTAIYGISAWRREIRGKRLMELSEDALSMFYEVYDVVNYMRSPGGYSDEGKSRESEENETEREKNARDRAYVMFERYNQSQETFNQLYSMRYRFMAQL